MPLVVEGHACLLRNITPVIQQRTESGQLISHIGGRLELRLRELWAMHTGQGAQGQVAQTAPAHGGRIRAIAVFIGQCFKQPRVNRRKCSCDGLFQSAALFIDHAWIRHHACFGQIIGQRIFAWQACA